VVRKPTYEELNQKVMELREEARKQKQRSAHSERRVVELEQSNQELNHFIEKTSQDLQQALDAVTRYLQFVEARYKDRIDPDAAAFIDSAVDGAQKMRELITDLLVYLRKRHPNCPPFDSSE